MTDSPDVVVVLPAVEEDEISTGLYHLSRLLAERDSDAQHHGFLGGEHGYGQEFENDVFEMFPFWWGDCECGFDHAVSQWEREHLHAGTCYQAVLNEARRAAGLSWWDGEEYHPDVPASDGVDDFADDSGSSFEQWRARENAVYERVCEQFGLPMFGCAVHCTCGRREENQEWLKVNGHDPRCPEERPNFRHKLTGVEVSWYKYIGRDMETNRQVGRDEWRLIMSECVRSLGGDAA